MIATHGLTKRYGRTLAVDDLSFTVTPGVVTGFLGPNGSGKSTTMRMIVGLDVPDAGSATVNGSPTPRCAGPCGRWVRCSMRRRSTPGGQPATICAGWPRRTTSTSGGWTRCSTSSGSPRSPTGAPASSRLGMGQRLGVASALLGDPGVLLFDEPVNGLDPEGIRWIRHLLRDLAAEGRTVLVSSHLISEMALTAQRLVVIGRGTLIAETSVEEFTASSQGDIGPHRHADAAAIRPGALRGRGTSERRRRRRHHRARHARRRHRRARCPHVPHRARADTGARLPRGRVHGS